MEHLDFLYQLKQLKYLLKINFLQYINIHRIVFLPGPASLQSTTKNVGLFILTPRSIPGP